MKRTEPLFLQSGCHCLSHSQSLEQEDKRGSEAGPPVPGWGWGCGRAAHRVSKVALCSPWQAESRLCLSGVGLFLGCALPCLCGFSFLILPQISAMLFWKIPAWLSHTERREGWASTKRHLVLRTPGVRGRQLGESSLGGGIEKPWGEIEWVVHIPSPEHSGHKLQKPSRTTGMWGCTETHSVGS